MGEELERISNTQDTGQSRYHPSIFLEGSRGNHNKPQIWMACLLAKIQAWHHSQYRVIIVRIHSFTLRMLYTMPTHHITTTVLIAQTVITQ